MKALRANPELTTILGADFSGDHPMRGDRRYVDYLRSAQQNYEPWDKTYHRAAGKGLDADLAWSMIKSQRLLNRRPLPLANEAGLPLTFWMTDASQREAMMIDQELAGRILRPTSGAITDDQRRQYVLNSLMEEAIASSQLEGAAATRKDAKRMLRKGLKPRNEGEQMIVNNYRAMQFICDNLDTRLSEGFIHDLHRITTHLTMPEDEIGRWRRADEDVRVEDDRDHEVIHEPPAAETLPSRMKKLITFANRDYRQSKQFVHPLVQAIAIHFQFGYEHPYCDGNGRVARALFYWSVLRRGYWLFEFLPLSKVIKDRHVQYTNAYRYTEHDDFDLNYFLAFNFRVIGRARELLHAYLRKQEKLRQRADTMLDSDPGLNPRQRLLLLQLRDQHAPTITIAEHENRSGVTYATARQDLLDLAEAGYLRRETRGKKFVFHLAGP